MEELQRKQKEYNVLKQNLSNQLEILNKRQAELDKMNEERIKQLETISAMSATEAKEQLIESMRDEANSEAMVLVREITDEAKLTAATEAKNRY